MFNFFKKTEPKEEYQEIKEENLTMASVTYFIKKDGPVIVDIAVHDYDTESMAGLFSVLDTLSEDKCYIETIGIIRESLINDGKEDLALLLISHVAKQMTNTKTTKVINSYQESFNSQPCIKPSDMLQ